MKPLLLIFHWVCRTRKLNGLLEVTSGGQWSRSCASGLLCLPWLWNCGNIDYHYLLLSCNLMCNDILKTHEMVRITCPQGWAVSTPLQEWNEWLAVHTEWSSRLTVTQTYFWSQNTQNKATCKSCSRALLASGAKMKTVIMFSNTGIKIRDRKIKNNG